MDNHLRPQRLLAFLDDEVSKNERLAIEHHLSLCSSCSEEMERLRADLPKLLGKLQEIDSTVPPPPPKPWPAFRDLLKRPRAEEP